MRVVVNLINMNEFKGNGVGLVKVLKNRKEKVSG